MSNINEFLAFVKANGIARVNRFRLTMNLPQVVVDRMANELGTSLDDGLSRSGYSESINKVYSPTLGAYALSIMCHGVTLPGTTVSTQDMKHQNSTRKMPTDKSYSDFECTFISSGNMLERKVFDAWIGAMFNKDHTVAYYDDYVVDVSIEVLNESDEVVYTYKLSEAYPSAINPLGLDRSTANQFQTFQASFHFTKPKRVEDEFGVVRKRVVDSYNLQGVPQTLLGDISLTLPLMPSTSNMSVAAIDIYRNIEDMKDQVANGMSPRSAQILFRGVLRQLDSIETISSFEFGDLSNYVEEIINTLGRS